uniref:uncharacterized protein LOC100182085 isoform X2 n=1 Tax=Ciona intestinalis TaxID=7719 RepID=UPI0002B8D103|nr:uncharacterized protein LOC100182085 isoform X2 [Ciona intestinalis]|eukprot:XP_004225521.1 uncharacterized protein LOC100182085 isoform X2 [Ciona intestinalis]
MYGRNQYTGNLCIMKPTNIQFSQDSVAKSFKNEGAELHDTCQLISTGSVSADEIRPIRVIIKDNKAISVDNRRLYVFRVLEISGHLHSIKVQVINQYDEERFTSTNNGCHVRLRSGGRRQRAPPAYRHCECYEGISQAVFSPSIYGQHEVQGRTNMTRNIENKQPARQSMASTTQHDEYLFAKILLFLLFIFFLAIFPKKA